MQKRKCRKGNVEKKMWKCKKGNLEKKMWKGNVEKELTAKYRFIR